MLTPWHTTFCFQSITFSWWW